MFDMSDLTMDILSESVPVLDERGTNWPIFAIRFKTAVCARGLWGHFDGTRQKPVRPRPTGKIKAEEAVGTSTSDDVAESLGNHDALASSSRSIVTEEEIFEWERNEAIARCLLIQCLPDTIALITREYDTVAGIWKYIENELTYRSAVIQAGMRTRFMQ
ncbi:hypothetical protein D9756_008889 [Leucocoprinus leucothites]|uniref:Uncharacterized protein n=1 Tax=Leucocoprinus leucothites TaxID=201217 RepID=A0A8H5FUU3_9AGAR|nr:hypothetical protein D9756_008889 [Leucoagaricus leucothites]